MSVVGALTTFHFKRLTDHLATAEDLHIGILKSSSGLCEEAFLGLDCENMILLLKDSSRIFINNAKWFQWFKNI